MKRFFSKINAILIGGVLGGALLAGIGCGIAFGEYSSFTYESESAIKESPQTQTETLALPQNGTAGVYENGASEKVADENVARGTFVVEMTYDAALITPLIYELDSYYLYRMDSGELVTQDTARNMGLIGDMTYEQIAQDERFVQRITYFPDYRYAENAAERFMQSKDVILEGLKNGVIRSVNANPTIDIVVRVNPAEFDRVEIIPF